MSFRPAARQFFETRKTVPVGVPYVECLNNTNCLCHTASIASQSAPYTISAWINTSSLQPSLSEGRTITLTGTEGSITAGLELGLSSELEVIGAFIQAKSYDLKRWDYSDYFDSWHNFVITYSGSGVNTYLDGVLKATATGSLGTITNAKLGIGCLQWYGSMISGGPVGKYANVAYWGRVLGESDMANVVSSIDYVPTDAEHRYDMIIQNGAIADIGTVGGWDLSTVRDFQNGVYLP